jgi:hypothetical protein
MGSGLPRKHELCRAPKLDSPHQHAALYLLPNGFSRKIQNHDAAVALNYFAYNFIKIHRTLARESGNGRAF